jgi:hypothetical protein
VKCRRKRQQRYVAGQPRSCNIHADRHFLQLVFASRVLFVVVLSTSKVSTISLIQEIFTKDATKWWFRVIAVLSVTQAVAGSLMISVDCSPAETLEGKDHSTCPGNVRFHLFSSRTDVCFDLPSSPSINAPRLRIRLTLFSKVPRWIVFTVIEALLECSMVIPVTIIVMKLQTSLQRKLWAIAVFVCRLVYASTI